MSLDFVEPENHNNLHKILLLDFIMSQLIPVHTFTHWFSMARNKHPIFMSSNWSLRFRSSGENFMLICNSFPRATCPAHIVYLDLIIVPAGTGNFSLRHHVQTGSGAHPASYPVGTGGCFPGANRPVHEADHSPPSSAEVKECVELYLRSPNTSSWHGA
jgi:hypothetical protein